MIEVSVHGTTVPLYTSDAEHILSLALTLAAETDSSLARELTKAMRNLGIVYDESYVDLRTVVHQAMMNAVNEGPQPVKQFIIIDTEDGFILISPNTLEFCNQGSNAYPPHQANNLTVGEELKSTFNDGRAIRRVS